MTTKISVYNLDSSITNAIGSGGGPKIQTIVYPGNDTAVNTNGGDTVFLNGSGFTNGCTIIVNGATVPSVTFNSSSNVGFTTSAQSSGGYPIYLVNPDGGTAIAVPGLQYSGVPSWTTASGSIGSVYETTAFANTVIAVGDAPISYNVVTGSLPTGASLNTASGLISGSSVATASPTTYNFTIRATDAQFQDTDRAFSLTVNPDVVTWSSPANNVTYNIETDTAISNVSLAATSAVGYGVQYSANTLPTGLTLSGNTISGTPTTVGSTNTLVTATANTTTRTAQQIINWVVSVGADIYFPYVTTLLSANTALMPFNDDASTNNFNVTINGDTKPNNFNPHQGSYYSNLFDGTGDELTWSGTTIGSSQYTFECWFYLNVLSGTQAILGTTVTSGMNIRVPSATVIQVDAYNNSGTQFTVPTMVVGQWYHLVVCRGASNLTTVFLNGTRSSTGTVGISTNYSSCTRIGASVDLSNFNGYISNARLVVGSTVYDPTQSTITVPTSPLTAVTNTQLLTCQSNRFRDNSTNNYTITRNGDTRVSSFIPFTPATSYATYGSAYFDGTGDSLQIASSTPLSLNGDFTVEAWIWLSANNLTYPYVFASGTFYIRFGDVGFGYKFSGATNDTSVSTVYSSATLQSDVLNRWTHVAFTRQSGVNRLFVNGTQQNLNTGANPSTYPLTSWTDNTTVGGSTWQIGTSWNGYISDFRVIKGTALYTASFTPPTTQLTAVANTSLLTCQTNQTVNNNVFIDESSNNFLVTRNGNATQGTFSPYGENWSNYFDGTGDYLTLPAASSALYLSGAFTFETWIYPISSSGTIYGNWNNQSGDAWGFIYSAGTFSAGFKIFFYRGNYGSNECALGTTTGLNLNAWNHFAVTRDTSNNIYIFLNGVSLSLSTHNTPSLTWSNSFNFTNTSAIGIGGTSNYSSFNGYISNARFVSGTALYTANFTPSTTPLQSVANTQLLACQSSGILDNSPNRFSITRSGDVSVQKFGPFGQVTLPTPYYSAYFDGTGDYLTVPDNAALQMGSGDFTIEFYIYYTSIAGYITPFSKGYTAAGDILFQTGNGNGAMIIYLSGSAAITESTGAIVNQWYHYALVRSGTTVTLYRNGVSTGTATSSVNFNSSQQVGIGATGTAPGGGAVGNFPVTGYMSNVRIVKGTAVYTGTFTPSTTPLTAIANTSLLTCQSATFIDNSPNNFTITANGNSQPTRVNPFTQTYSLRQIYSPSVYGGSMYFDGNGDFISTPTNTAFSFGTGDFTIEGWIYTGDTSLTGGGYSRSVCGIGNLNFYLRINQYHGGTTGALRIYDGTTHLADGSTTNLATNSWRHFALVRESGTAKLWIDGIYQTGGAYTTNLSNTNQNNIGAQSGPTEGYFNGYISDIRVVKGQAVYRGTANFVPSNAPVTAVRNTTLLLNGTTGGIIDSSDSGNFETVGDAKLNTAVTKFAGGTSMYFDGTGDYIVSGPSQNFAVTGDYTIEFWIYWNSIGNIAMLFGWNQGASGATFAYTYSDGRIGIGINGTNEIVSSSGQATTGSWIHMAFVRNGSTTTIYKNGTSIATNTTSVWAGNTGTTGFYIAGSGTATNTNCYISDFRITKGIARYTSNFTPATTPFKQY